VKYLDLKEEQFVEREQELESRFEIQRKELGEREKMFHSNVDFVEKLNVLDSLEEQLEEKEKVFVSKEEKFKLQVMHLSETKSV